MFPLGHVAVACGVVWVGAHAIDRARGVPQTHVSPSDGTSVALHPQRIATAIDYRLVALGGLVPDLVDRPLDRIFRGFFDGNGHLIGHTLLFALLILLPGLYLWQRARDTRLAAIGVADLSHLLVDPINHSPEIFFWPLLGTDFPEVTFLGTKLTLLEVDRGGAHARRRIRLVPRPPPPAVRADRPSLAATVRRWTVPPILRTIRSRQEGRAACSISISSSRTPTPSDAPSRPRASISISIAC